jgi:hypothetical protein
VEKNIQLCYNLQAIVPKRPEGFKNPLYKQFLEGEFSKNERNSREA